MAYDEDLAYRIRELVAGEPALTERQMFGGGVLVRIDPAASNSLTTRSGAELMEMQGRKLEGWLRVDDDHLRTKRQLRKWIDIDTAYARSLPAK
jgi:TfoX/Sxy family transcriptional regulator of competence genes